MRQYTKETGLIRWDNERCIYKPSCRKNYNHFDGNRMPLCKKYNHFLNEIQSHTLTASLPPPPAPAALVMMQLWQTSTVYFPSIQALLGRNVSSRGLVLASILATQCGLTMLLFINGYHRKSGGKLWLQRCCSDVFLKIVIKGIFAGL